MSGNSKGAAKRSIKSAQIGVREIHFGITGTAGTPAATGLDRFLVASVVDNGAGDYTINLTGKASSENNVFLKGWSTSTPDTTLSVTAVTGSSIQVACTAASTGAAQDADISLTLGLTDNRFQYEA